MDPRSTWGYLIFDMQYMFNFKLDSVNSAVKTLIIQIIASGAITSWQIGGETVETVRDFIFGGLQNHCRW